MDKHGPDYELADIHAEKRRLHSIISTKDAELEEERRMHQWTGDLLTLERSRIRQLEEAVEWACKKLDDDISFSKQHFESSTNEDCVCWLCDETAFAEIIRRRAGVKE